MKILFLLQEFPFPPDNGTRWKPYNLLRGLSSNHRCDLICFAEQPSAADINGLESACPGVKVLGVHKPLAGRVFTRIKGFLKTGLPSSGPYASSDFENAIIAALSSEQYDLVHLDMINLVQHARLISTVPVLISVNDAVSLGYQNRISGLEGLPKLLTKVARYLIEGYEQKEFRGRTVHVVASPDQQYLQTRVASASIVMIKLPVETSYLDEDPPSTQLSPERVIAIPANFSTPGLANQIEDVIAAYDRKPCISAATFHLFGRAGTAEFISKMKDCEHVKYLGWIEDYKSQLLLADVVLFPETAGAGTKNRALQAMSLGKPVLLHPSAAAGIGGTDGTHYITCRTPQDFASSAKRLCEDVNLSSAIGSAARRLMRIERHPDVINQQWEDLYLRLSSNRKTNSKNAVTAEGIECCAK